jgi:hypothetical protein
MTITVLTHERRCLFKCQRNPRIPSRFIQDLVQRGATSLSNQLAEQVLLQRLMGGRSPIAQHGVNVRRNVLDLNARHGAILAPLDSKRKRIPRMVVTTLLSANCMADQ